METTDATVTDYEMTPVIHEHLAQHDRLPGEHLVDSGYMTADHLVSSREHGIDLVGPVADDPSWQAQAGEGFASTAFVIDWQAQQARCPQGHLSQKWQREERTAWSRGALPVFPDGVCRLPSSGQMHAREDHPACGDRPTRNRPLRRCRRHGSARSQRSSGTSTPAGPAWKG